MSRTSGTKRGAGGGLTIPVVFSLLLLLMFFANISRRTVHHTGPRTALYNAAHRADDVGLPWRRCECYDAKLAPSADCSIDKSFAPEGLTVLPNYLSEEDVSRLQNELDRFQFQPYADKSCLEFGFNFTFYILTPAALELPPVMRQIADRLHRDGLMINRSNYVLVNRYTPGQGIHGHWDDLYYEDGIVSLTLESAAPLYFLDVHGEHENGLPLCRSLVVPVGGVFAMRRRARYNWSHGMVPRLTDLVDGVEVPRRQRTAVTFRVVKPRVIEIRQSGQLVNPFE